MQEGNDRQLAFWDNFHSTHLERIPQGLLVHSPDSGRVDLTWSEHVVPSSFEMSPEIGIPFPIRDIDQRATLQPTLMSQYVHFLCAINYTLASKEKINMQNENEWS